MERKWKYYIVLNNDREDLIEETENEDPVNGLPLCQDYTKNTANAKSLR